MTGFASLERGAVVRGFLMAVLVVWMAFLGCTGSDSQAPQPDTPEPDPDLLVRYDFDVGFLDGDRWEEPVGLMPEDRQVRERNGSVQARGSASEAGSGEQAPIATVVGIDRPPQVALVYRAEISELSLPMSEKFRADPSLLDGIDVRGFLGLVTDVAGQRKKLPFFEPDSAIVTVEGDFSFDSTADGLTLDGVYLVLSAKEEAPRQVCNSVGSVLGRWKIEDVGFPITVELAVDDIALGVRAFRGDRELSLIPENESPPASAVSHGHSETWLSGGFAAIGAENVAGRSGAVVLESLSILLGETLVVPESPVDESLLSYFDFRSGFSADDWDDRSAEQVRDADPAGVSARGAGAGDVEGEQAVIITHELFERSPGERHRYAAVVNELRVSLLEETLTEDGVVLRAVEDPETMPEGFDGADTRGLFGVVSESGSADQPLIPFFERDAVIVTIEGDFSYDNGVVLDGVSVVLSAKEGANRAVVNATQMAIGRWSVQEPKFPMRVELAIGDDEFAVSVEHNGEMLPLLPDVGSADPSRIPHDFSGQWMRDGFLLLGAENVVGRFGETVFSSFEARLNESE